MIVVIAWLPSLCAVASATTGEPSPGAAIGLTWPAHHVPDRRESGKDPREPPPQRGSHWGRAAVSAGGAPSSGPGGRLSRRRAQGGGEPAPGGDAEFPERLAEVVFHGGGGHEQVGRDLRVGRARSGQAADMRLLRRQVRAWPLLGLTGTVTRGEQLGL